MRAYNVFVGGPNFTNFFPLNAGGIVVPNRPGTTVPGGLIKKCKVLLFVSAVDSDDAAAQLRNHTITETSLHGESKTMPVPPSVSRNNKL